MGRDGWELRNADRYSFLKQELIHEQIVNYYFLIKYIAKNPALEIAEKTVEEPVLTQGMFHFNTFLHFYTRYGIWNISRTTARTALFTAFGFPFSRLKLKKKLFPCNRLNADL